MSLTIESVTDVVYSTATGSKIDCNVKFAEYNEILPFTATADDVETHAREIFERAVAGEYGAISDYVAPPPPSENPARGHSIGPGPAGPAGASCGRRANDGRCFGQDSRTRAPPKQVR